MSKNPTPPQCTTLSLVYKLCSHVTKKSTDNIGQTCKFVMKSLGSTPCSKEYDDFVIAEKIKKKLAKQGRHKDALTFAELNRKFQNSAVWKNKNAMLVLLHDLYGTNKQFDKYAQFANELARIAASSPELVLYSNDIITTKPRLVRKKIDDVLPENIKIGLPALGIKESQKIEQSSQCQNGENQSRVARVSAMFSKPAEKEKQQIVTWSSVKKETSKQLTEKPPDQEKVDINVLLQRDIVRDVLYAVQGISGKNIVVDQGKSRLKLSVNSKLPNNIQALVSRFAEMGWMYSTIDNFCKVHCLQRAPGLMSQSFISALQDELIEYYRLLATLQAQFKEDIEGKTVLSPLTLQRLSVWFMDPFLRLKVLASIVDAANQKKGGELATIIFSYMQHGNKDVSEPSRRLLKKVIQPFYKMVSNWIFWGELDDIYEEFFVIANMTVPESNMWYDKYSLKKSMIPSFISKDQAKRILSTGKAINFLRQVCKDHTFVKDSKHSKKCHDAKQVESIFRQECDGEFQILLDKNYQRTSSLVINVLYNEYKLIEHFKALRDYFLLGQGDFIRHLMDLLNSDLSMPASGLLHHQLSGTLECAIRATNAQFHDPDILERLDISLHVSSLNDIGWDIFTLSYNVSGPIETIFTSDSMKSYTQLFEFLWKSKRMEYLLSNMTQYRTTSLKIQCKIPAVIAITYQSHVILSQMVHFVQQIQYYFAFEVMECCWADLQRKIQSAKDLDEIIMAHESFLNTLLKRSLLNVESDLLRYQLFAIYNQITEFHNIVTTFWSQAQALVSLDEQILKMTDKKTKSGTWGVLQNQSAKFDTGLQHLIKLVIPQTKRKLAYLANSFETVVQSFLLSLNDNEDSNLEFLSFRLDFNEYYKTRNTQLQTSLTYLHRRKSMKYSM